MVNEYYKVVDGFCTYYVNKSTGDKKLKLDENEVEIEREVDDFTRQN